MKHHDKIQQALEIRRRNAPKGSGYKSPGTQTPRKTSYHGTRARTAR